MCISSMYQSPPGHFDVVLIVDNCETNAKSHFRGVLLKELSKYGDFSTALCTVCYEYDSTKMLSLCNVVTVSSTNIT